MVEIEEKQILVLGLKSERDKFILSYSDEKLTRENYIDTYNNKIKEAILQEAEKLTTKERWQNFTKNLYSYIPINIKMDPIGKHYLQSLQEKEKNKLENIYKDVYILKLKEKCLFEKDGEVISPILHAKRGCKIGIDAAIKNANTQLFFVIDGINMRNVVHKKDLYNRSITNRELRYIYRHRYALEGKITFFSNGKQCEAPWEKDPQLWSEYKHSSQSFIYKYRDIISKKQGMLKSGEHSSIKQPLNHLTEKAINEQKHRNSLLSNSNENIKIKQNKELSKE